MDVKEYKEEVEAVSVLLIAYKLPAYYFIHSYGTHVLKHCMQASARKINIIPLCVK